MKDLRSPPNHSGAAVPQGSFRQASVTELVFFWTRQATGHTRESLWRAIKGNELAYTSSAHGSIESSPTKIRENLMWTCSGHGVLLAPMGESYAGEFVNGTPCGHGVYVYPGLAEHTPESTSSVSPAVPRRCRHKGAFNGAPAGPGVLEWSNGKAEWAVWRGLQALERLSQTDVRLHATLAHAEDAHDIARSSQKRARDALIACVKEGRVTRETALRVMLHDTTCDRILI